METYDWKWVETQVARLSEIWRENTWTTMETPRQFSPSEQQARERAYDEALDAVEGELHSENRAGAKISGKKGRIVTCFGIFSARALDLDDESIDVLTHEFLPVGTELASWARQFDPDLSMPSIIQAARNAWTACGLQPLLGANIKLTPAILGYSLLYPYSDNYLDDEDVAAEEKLRFSRRFRLRLMGHYVSAEDGREHAMWRLIELIEAQYPRAAYPQVFESLLAIHRAQEESITQINARKFDRDAECLRVSCAKGGSSVLADACLAHGSLDEKESRFAFEWGVLLQLGDDLQDVREDMRRGSVTLFSRAARGGLRLDGLTAQLLGFSERVWRNMEQLPWGTKSYRELMKMSWRSLIIRAVADSHEFFSGEFLQQAERSSPFRFGFLRARNERVASQQGLYAALFSSLLEDGGERTKRLPQAMCSSLPHASQTRTKAWRTERTQPQF